MKTKYAVYNALTGENVLYETKDEALLAFLANVTNFAKSHFYNTAYSIVEQNDDGSETWLNDQNQEIVFPETPAEIQSMIDFANSLENPTPIENLP